MNILNVLSIDFDFFQIVDSQTLMNCYPDGVDLSTDLSQMVWAGHYANPKTSDALVKVKANETKIQEMLALLKRCKSNIPVLIVNSHAKIYDFIVENANRHETTKVDITNVDMHHDMFNNNLELDCGNWIKFVSQDFDATVKWIANPVSKECYGLNDKIFEQIKEDFSDILPEKIDILFICRSDIWLPPHLDSYFMDFAKAVCEHFDDVYGEPAVEEPRDIKEMVSHINSLYDAKKS